MQPFELDTYITTRDRYRLHLARYTKRVLYRIFLVLRVILIVLSAIVIVLKLKIHQQIEWYIWGGLCLVFGYPLAVRQWIKSHAKKGKEEAVHWRISEDTISVIAADIHSELGWSRILKYEIAGGILLLFTSPLTFLMLPVEGLSDEQLAAIKTLVDGAKKPVDTAGSQSTGSAT